ncbi:MAG: DnaJ domain-containing protein [Gammaproteobacteria bacterium]
MRNNRNYYQILHVQQDAPVEVIRSSYRTMMQRLKMHPDLGGDHEEAAIVNQAYSVLTNAEKRAEYDAGLEEETKSDSTEAVDKSKSSTSSPIYNQHVDTAKSCSFCKAEHNFGKAIEADCVCSECGSTLFPAVKQMFENDDNRIIQRIDKQWPVTFFTQWPDAVPYVGQTHDVSLNGIQMVTSVFLQEGQIVKMKSQMLDAVARVMNSREDYNQGTKLWRVGLQFITLRFYSAQGTFLKLEL